MNCLDTYALVEIHNQNPAYAGIVDSEIILCDLILAEFYGVLLRSHDKKTADYWFNQLAVKSKPATQSDLQDAMLLRHKHRKKRLSFFDCVGYVFARRHQATFITCDKQLQSFSGTHCPA